MGARTGGIRNTVIARAIILAIALLIARHASAEGLTADEQQRLAAGELVKRNVTFDRYGARYVGGIAYAIVQAPTEAVMNALRDVRTYRAILPLTIEARERKRDGSDRWVTMRHGGRLGTAAYTMHIRQESSRL